MYPAHTLNPAHTLHYASHTHDTPPGRTPSSQENAGPYSNRELWELYSPAKPYLPYIYDNFEWPHCEAAGMPVDMQPTGFDDDRAVDDAAGFDQSGDDSTRPDSPTDAMDPNDVTSEAPAPDDTPDTPPGMTDFMKSFMEAHKARQAKAGS